MSQLIIGGSKVLGTLVPPLAAIFFQFHAVLGGKIANKLGFGVGPPWSRKSWIRYWSLHDILFQEKLETKDSAKTKISVDKIYGSVIVGEDEVNEGMNEGRKQRRQTERRLIITTLLVRDMYNETQPKLLPVKLWHITVVSFTVK